MPGALVLLLGCCASLPATSWAQPQLRPSRPVFVPPAIEAEIRGVLDAYATGDDDAVERWMASRRGSTTTAHAEAVALKSAQSWRVRAAFLLEVAVIVRIDPRVSSLLATGRSIVTSRPAPLGADPDSDRYEVLWHQTAIAIAQGLSNATDQQGYLDQIVPRFEDAKRRGVTLESRIPLAQAIAAATRCCFSRVPGQVIRDMPRPGYGPTVDVAVRLFRDAAASPALFAEATIRGAKLLHETGGQEAALAWFERVPPLTDAVLAFTHHLTRARVFDVLQDPEDAARAYAEALAVAPRSQLAAIGHAAALLRAGQLDAAEQAATVARQLPATEADFTRMMEFSRGDARFVRGWLLEIRRLRS